MTNQTVSLRVICEHPSPAPFGLQDKHRDIAEAEQLADGGLAFSLQLKVKQADTGQPNFTGTYAHGTVQDRFLYLTQKVRDGKGWRILKRLKIPLKSITWEQVEAVLTNPNAVLQVTVSGHGTGTVPLLGDGWTVELSN